ncbi:MAG: hypothetical protein LAP87_27740 [Acidobacteriia bacterium]|nr:hypothetical protein [Terriglobia bacterium]
MNNKYIFVLSLVLLSVTAAWPQAASNVTLNLTPSRAIGSPQLVISGVNPNLVEGRELDNPRGAALDTSVSPPILYVSDFANNRVLAWKNAASLNNGQKADLAVGQPDLLTTLVGGPGSAFTTGLNHPVGIAVFKGDLYVVDAGNNRVLRYPKPFDQVARGTQFPKPDLFIGQTSLNGRSPNFTGLVNAQGIFLSSGNTIFDSAVAFDASGNLWLVDAGNRRVLRFKAADLAGGGGQFADLELGQLDLNSTQTPFNAGDARSRFILNQFDVPGTLGFDADGNLFVADSDSNPVNISRVLVFTPPFASGQSASRLAGVFPANLTSAPPQQQIDQAIMVDPEGLFFTSTNQVGVVDRQSNRVVIFDPLKQWPTDGSPPLARQILGQQSACATFPNQACRAANNGNPRPSASTFSQPTGAAYAGGTLYVADTANNRVLVLRQNADGTFGSAATVLGQDRFDTNSINLIEGKEFQFANGVGTDAGIAVDLSGSTPHLYVSDPGNNRVLGFSDLRKLTPGRPADIVIGQPDMQTALCNPSGDATRPTQNSLCRPVGLTVDASGNLYVADSGNGRVLRFPAPFSYNQANGPEPADLVLGQANFFTKITDPSNSTMAIPYGVAITGINGLVVSDQFDNRVLYFPFSSGGTFNAGSDNGRPATVVYGQQNFTTIRAGNDDASLNNPHHVAADGEGRIYVADTANNRVVIFPDPHSIATPLTGARSTQQITGVNAPQGVHVNSLTGEIWVANTNGLTSLRWANYQLLQFGNGPTATIPETSGNLALQPLALATDQFGDLIVADISNRVAFFFQGLQALNLANVIPDRPLAPGTPASICSAGSNCQLNAAAQFGSNTAVAGSFPLQTTLADIQVQFNGRAVPLYGVVPRQINFLVPNDAPTSGSADLVVVQASTGQVLGAGLVPMSPVSPGILLPNPTVIGNALGPVQQAAVLNQDSSANSPTNPAKRGEIIQIFAVGQGFLPDAPADGSPAPTDHFISTPTLPAVVIGACSVDDAACTKESGEHIKFSGLAPTFAGVWQLNVQIPQNTDITNPQVVIGLIVNGVNSFDFTRYRTFIYVK